MPADSVQMDALKFFYPFASLEKKAVIDGALRKNAEEYLSFYIQVIDKNFPAFRTSFAPHTAGEIGFIGELVLKDRSLAMYGFRALREKDAEPVKFVPIDYHASEGRPNVSYLHGAESLHCVGSTNGFRSLNVEEEVLRHEIQDQLKVIIENGLLNEGDNTFLLLEKLIAVAYEYQRDLHRIKGRSHISQCLPIKFEDIEYGIRYMAAERFYQWETFSGKTRGRSGLGYLSATERQVIKEKAHIAARDRVQVKDTAVDIEFEKLRKAVHEAISHLRTRGMTAIESTIIPDSDTTICGHWIWSGYSPETQIEHARRIYQMFLDEYKELVQVNFKSLAEFFGLYSRMPMRCFMVPGAMDAMRESIHLQVYHCRADCLSRNEVILCNQDDLVIDREKWSLLHSGKEYKLDSVLYTGFEHFFGASRTYCDFKIPNQLATLRYLVYDKLQSEMNKVLDVLFERYGVTRSR